MTMPISRIVSQLDFSSRFYRNCRIQRRRDAKICGECPFRELIEAEELWRDCKDDPHGIALIMKGVVDDERAT